MTRTGPPDEDWIVCLQRTRNVVDGFVRCPIQDPQRTALTNCESCRHLAWRRDERLRPEPCSTEQAVSVS